MSPDEARIEAGQPRFAHDCRSCTYLGNVDGQDLYHCLQGVGSVRLPTVIRRYSAEPADYVSGLALADVDPVLSEARRRAVERGLHASLEIH